MPMHGGVRGNAQSCHAPCVVQPLHAEWPRTALADDATERRDRRRGAVGYRGRDQVEGA
jgi:hypothetical protein